MLVSYKCLRIYILKIILSGLIINDINFLKELFIFRLCLYLLLNELFE